MYGPLALDQNRFTPRLPWERDDDGNDDEGGHG